MLLELSLAGRQLISAQEVVNPRAIFMGTLLAPWPNRLADGSYELDGREYRFENLDAQNNLNHGLLGTRTLEVVDGGESDGSALALRYLFGSDENYPSRVELSLTFEISATELSVSAEARNLGEVAAPFAIGFHPYFLVGDDFEVSGDFTHHIKTDKRMLPVSTEPVEGLRYAGGPIDDCYFGANTVSVSTEDGEFAVELGENMSHFMFYRPGLDVGPSMLAIEPMSAPANVFADDIASVLIAPGDLKRFGFVVRTR